MTISWCHTCNRKVNHHKVTGVFHRLVPFMVKHFPVCIIPTYA